MNVIVKCFTIVTEIVTVITEVYYDLKYYT